MSMPSMMSIVDGAKTKAFGLRLRCGLGSNYVILGAILLTDSIREKAAELHYYTGVRYKVPEEGGMFPPMLNDLPESSIYLPTSKQTEILKEIKRRNALSEGEDPPPF